mgnify:CR=1 FL=1
MNFNNLLWEISDNILTITINRADKLNALNGETILEIKEAFTEARKVENLKGIIITGAGEKAFVAGADIAEFQNLDTTQAKALAQRGHDIFFLIERFPKPVVAAVNGFALGGGCELAMACHLRVAGEKAKFGQPEVNLGLIPGYGGTQRLPQLVGKGRAMEMIMTAGMISAEDAYRAGLVNHVVAQAELLDFCKGIAARIMKNSPMAIGQAIKAVNANFKEGVNGNEFSIQRGREMLFKENFFLLVRHIRTAATTTIFL